MELRDQIIEQLKQVIDPELNINVVDLGLIYEIDIRDNKDVFIEMTLTTPGCPLHDSITSGVKHAVSYLDEVNDVEVIIVWQPAWSPEKMSPEAMQQLRGY
ncbi:metal-sulfur cluster assembly factor [Ferdinandcohnia quinoae]|uniref:Iron-sulfur cluster assembly protein n=1 Tax=Fredinandcohnia quinoae TaxID=2918902 RepID=A0AAW5E4U5_9BACI|nr:iron-sulfur cluster assembly protein [Fredinandcohnia sp. SECRCQ15]MCH1625849.1 iron-sulfur cluster assembly protein [Fredinandcohnia sp. SECRCQ15]